MNKKLSLPALLFLCAWPVGLAGAETNAVPVGPEALKKIGDQFIGVWCGVDTNGSLADFLKWAAYKPIEVTAMATKVDAQRLRRPRLDDPELGKRLDPVWEYAGSMQFGTSLRKLVYLERFELKVIPWSLWFYKAGDEWKLNNFSLDDEAIEELWVTDGDKSAKPEIPLQMAEKLFKALAANQDEEGFKDLIKPHYFQPEHSAALVEQMMKSYRTARVLFQQDSGKLLPGGFEHLATRRMGHSLIKVYYVEKHDHGIMPWALAFYKVRHEWKLLSIAFGDAVPRSDLAAIAVIKGPL
jgi:hypothetical protein